MYQNLSLGYKMEFDRVSSNTSFKDDDTISRNIIIINIKNNIDVIVYTIRMNEADCIKLLDYITAYLYDFFDWGDRCDIKLSLASSTTGRVPIIHFQNISNNINENNQIYYDRSMDEYRYHEMSIYELDTSNNQYIKILSVPMGCTEVEEFVYWLYFTGLMDLTLPEEILEHLDEILARIFGEGFWNCN